MSGATSRTNDGYNSFSLLYHRLDVMGDSFVGVPLTYIAFNILLAGLLSLWEHDSGGDDGCRLIEQSQRMSSYVSTAAISIVTLTFSLTVLSIQIAAQSYSPRLLDDFLKDPVAKVVISANLGAYAYCYAVVYFVPECGDGALSMMIPKAMIHVLSVHMLAILVSFVEFIHFFINGFRIEKILSRAAASSLRAAQILSLQEGGSGGNGGTSSKEAENRHDDDTLLQVPTSAYRVLADKSGYVNSFRLSNILQLAKKMDICVRYTYQIGEFVNEGTVMCYIWDAEADDDKTSIEERAKRMIDCDDHHGKPWENMVERKLGYLAAKGIKIQKIRSGDLDVTLGIQQLSDIAVRALSQAINDPHTAIQCMDNLSDLLARLGVMDLGVPSVRDSKGIVRACAPRRSFAFLLSLLDSIRRYGATDLNVCRRGIRLYGDLACILTRANRIDRVVPAVAQLQQWMLTSRQSFPAGSPELKNLQELYEHELDAISDAEDVHLDEPEIVSRDRQFFETTLTSSDRNLPTKEWDDLMRQMDSAKSLAAEMSDDFSKNKSGAKEHTPTSS